MNRLLHVDALKGILILLVILGHSIQYVIGESCFDNKIWNCIYSFHMPCFMAISGYFAPMAIQKADQLYNFIWRRFQQLMLPMLLWQAVYIILPPPSKNVTLLSFIDCGNFWFLWALFFISLIYAVVVYLSGKLHVSAIVLHIGVSVLLIGLMLLKNYHQHGIQYIAYYYPFFVMGCYLNRKLDIRNIDKKWFWFAFLLWFVGAIFWRMHEAPRFLTGFKLVSSSILTYGYRYIVGFVAIFAFYGLSALYMSKEHSWTSLFARVGGLSLGIYTIHILLLKMLRPYLVNTVNVPNTLSVVLLFIVLTVVSLVLVYCISHNKIASRCLLGKLK